MPRRGARSAFGTVNLRVEFQAKARKLLAEVDRLNKDERDQVQRGLDLNIIAVLPQEVGLPLAQQQPTLGAQCTLPQTIGLQAVPDDREDSEPRRSRQKRTCAMTWYSEAVNSGQGKTTAMLPPSPRRRRSARTAQRNIDTAQARAAEIAAVASASHVDSEGALTVDLTPGLRTRSQTRATVQFSPTAQVCSHDTGHDTVSTVGPATPSPRVVGRAPLWQQRQESTFNMMSDFQPSECPNEENGGQLVPNPNARSEPPSALCSPREDPTGAHLNALQDLTPIKKPFMQDGPTGLHDFPAAEALLSPALRAVCSGLDLSRLDGDALALSPINHGLSPLTLGLTDLPSPLTALPALVSPCPDSLQSPTVLPCLPLTPNKLSDLEMTPDAHFGPATLRLLSKPSGDTLSNSLRRRAAVSRALAGSFLQSPRDAQMINVRDLGSFASPRNPHGGQH